MHLRRYLDFGMATLVILGILLLRVEQGSVVVTLVAIAAALAAAWLADLTGRFHLPPQAINLGIAVATLVTLWRLVLARGLFEVSDLVEPFVYVQILLLFERKTFRTWWDLVSLSLFQVGMAASFQQSAWFGALLAVYVFTVLVVLTFLFLLRERLEYDRGAWEAAQGDPAALAVPRGVDWRRVGKVGLATVLLGPVSLFLRFRETPRPGSRRQRATAFVPMRLAGDSGLRAGVVPEFWRRMMRVMPGALFVGAAVFLVVPRFGGVQLVSPRIAHIFWSAPKETYAATIGFSDQVQLGDLGTVIEEQDQVLDIEFLDHAANRRYPLQGDIYLHGSLLTRYGNGRWEDAGSGNPAGLQYSRLSGGSLRGLVRQRIAIEPLDRELLFCVRPIAALRSEGPLWVDPRYERLYRPRWLAQRRVRFEVITPAFDGGMQTALVPSESVIDSQILTAWPAEAVPGLAAKAKEWLDQSGLSEDDVAGRARWLESQLRDSGAFGYSLQGQNRDPGLDPIEDFILNHPLGHCEYFATALALMLRSQGIPSRVVMGYKCDAYDFLGEVYRVRQSHAHAWVEAYLAPEQLPQKLPGPYPPPSWANGAWLRLDPTPARSAEASNVGREMWNWLERINFFWTQYVSGMNAARQRELIYDSLRSMAQELRPWFEPRRWTGQALAGSVWLLGLPAAALLVFVSFCRPTLRRLISRRAQSGHPAEPTLWLRVDFYHRLERVLARHGLVRPRSQTQWEYASQAGSMLASKGREELAGLPIQVAEAFYQVRFGGHRLDQDQAQAIEAALARLEQTGNGKVPRAGKGTGDRGQGTGDRGQGTG